MSILERSTSRSRWLVIALGAWFLLGGTNPLAAQGNEPFVRGDCNTDNNVNLADAIALLSELFAGGAPSSCTDACDVNDDGSRDIGDAVAILNHLFSGGADPAAPFPDCGTDPTADALTCIAYPGCPSGPSDPPPSFGLAGQVTPLPMVGLHVMPTVDVAQLELQDELLAAQMNTAPRRIGLNLKADLSPLNSGTVDTLSDGSKLWRVRVRCTGALWIGVGFGTCQLPPGVGLWVYDEALNQVDPRFPDLDPVHGQRWRYPILGDTAVIELHWSGTATPDVHLGTVLHGYRSPYGDFDCGEDCSPDVSCGDFGIQDINRGVIRMYVPIDMPHCDTTGVAMCSGSLINNTDGDCRQFVLTAAHCVVNPGLVGGSSFLFNYERPDCCDGEAPTDDTVEGATFRATWPGGFTDPPCFPDDPGGNDVALIEIDEDIPASFNARYNGWTRALDVSDDVGSVHQPAGSKSKKVAVKFDGYDLPNNKRLNINGWDIGTIKSGSSGSPLFNQDGRIIAVVSTGGPDSDCPGTFAGFGRFDAAWNGGGNAASRLRDWLDPNSTNKTTIPGREDVVNCDVPPYAGNVQANPAPAPAPGGTGVLSLSMTNGGDQPLTNVQGFLTSSHPLVTVASPIAGWPNLAPGETASVGDPFLYVVGTGVPCGTEVVFTCEITADSGDGPWFPEIRVRIGTPSTSTMPLGSFFLSESILGSNQWNLDSTDDTPAGLRYFIPDVPTASDTTLTAFGVLVPENTVLRFRQRMDCENLYGGGVFEIRGQDVTGGPGPWMDARPWMTKGAYNSGMAWTAPFELRNRAAFSGDTGDWQDVEVDLSEFAGQIVECRWRFATDDSGGDVGWWIDDAVLETTTYSCN